MKRFKNILYVNEPSVDRQETALARAVSLAERNRARLTVVDVIPAITAGYGLPPGGPISSELQLSVAGEHLRHLEKLAAPFTERVEIHLDVLVGKTRRALQEHPAQTFVIAGGVSANVRLRERLQTMITQDFPGTQFLTPEFIYSLDNAAMIGVAAAYRYASLSDTERSALMTTHLTLDPDANLPLK